MKRPYFICDHVPVRSQSGSGWPSQRSVSQPPATVPYASSRTPLAAQYGASPRPRALIEQRERHLVRHHLDAARHAPCRRWAVSTLVKPEMPDQPSRFRSCRRNSVSSQLGSA